MKPKVKSKFNKESKGDGGSLIFLRENGTQEAVVRTNQIDRMYMYSSHISIRAGAGDPLYVYSNFTILLQAYHAAHEHGIALDLRDICGLKKSDPLYKDYRKKEAGQDVLDQLRARVRLYKAEPFPCMKNK